MAHDLTLENLHVCFLLLENLSVNRSLNIVATNLRIYSYMQLEEIYSRLVLDIVQFVG
jgi:hypothetical protein